MLESRLDANALKAGEVEAIAQALERIDLSTDVLNECERMIALALKKPTLTHVPYDVAPDLIGGFKESKGVIYSWKHKHKDLAERYQSALDEFGDAKANLHSIRFDILQRIAEDAGKKYLALSKELATEHEILGAIDKLKTTNNPAWSDLRIPNTMTYGNLSRQTAPNVNYLTSKRKYSIETSRLGEVIRAFLKSY